LPVGRDDRSDQLDPGGILRPGAGRYQAIPASLSAALPPSALWGREAYASALLGDQVRGVETRRGRLEVNRFGSAETVHDYFKNRCGPTIEAFENIYANTGGNSVLAAELDAQLIELARQYLADGAMEWEYLLLTAAKR
jgi:hypothetical protein